MEYLNCPDNLVEYFTYEAWELMMLQGQRPRLSEKWPILEIYIAEDDILLFLDP